MIKSVANAGSAVAQELGQKKLATIVAVDLVGWSAMAELDETAALGELARVRGELERIVGGEGGRIFNTAGDGFMLEFASASGALSAAEKFCNAIERKRVRVGVHLGDVLVAQDGDLLGHGVNIAARLQEIAEPGAIVVSVDVQRAVRGVLASRLHANGAVRLEKMNETIEIFTLEAVSSKRGRARKREAVLAVLPFDNESDDDAMEYFSDGVADEIMLILMRQSKLKLIGRTSAFQFRGERKCEAAEALNATHVLDGAVRRARDRFRITAQLVECASGQALWSARYDRDIADAFQLQDDIAAEVAAALKAALAPGDRPSGQIDPAAYDLYLRARRTWLTLSDVEEERAETLLKRCVALAPEFAAGWAGLASVRAFLLPRSRDIIDAPAHRASMQAAEEALRLDPDCPQAFIALSLLQPGFSGHGEKLRLIDEARRRMPNDPALNLALAAALFGVGRISDALEALEFALHLDPLGLVIEACRATLMSARGDVAQGLQVAEGAWSRWPESPYTWWTMWNHLCISGRPEDALALAEPDALPKRAVSAKDVDALRGMAMLLRMAPETRRAAGLAKLDAWAQSRAPLPLSDCALVAAHGCAEEAFDLIDAALDAGRDLAPDNHEAFGLARSQSSVVLFSNFGGERWHRHPRFAKLCARLGLAAYWIDSGAWPDCADDAGYDFRRACADALR